MQRYPKYASVTWRTGSNESAQDLTIRVLILHEEDDKYLCRPTYGERSRWFSKEDVFDASNKLGIL